MRVHLVDGTYELFRAYYGAPARVGRDGKEVGAALGLGRSLLSLLRSEGATHVGVAFDHVIESFRNDLFDGYKTGDGVDPDLLAQFELAERVTHALGIVVWPMVEFEADDAVATVAHRCAAISGIQQVLLCSPDKDLAQCVRGERVVCVDRRRRKVIDEAAVVEKFGVPPASIPDWLALVGDAADGIPGVPGWGARTAAAALSTYGHVHRIPDDPDEWSFQARGKPQLAKTLARNAKQVDLYVRLATLRTDVPIEEGPEDLEWRGARRAEIDTVCDILGTRTLAERIPRWSE